MTAHGIELDTSEIRAFCERWKIRELCVFGSILQEDFRPDSDVDFLADFDPEAGWDLFDHMDMEDQLAAIIGRKVDLVSRSAILHSGNRYLQEEILSSAETIGATR
jgi:hypothetical protein